MLVQTYMMMMMPKVRRRSDDILVPLIDDYERVMVSIGLGKDEDGNPLPQDDKRKKYQRELMGTQVIESAPYSYWDAQDMLASEIQPDVWMALTIRQRAKIKAALRIKNMAELLGRHRDLMAEKARKAGYGAT